MRARVAPLIAGLLVAALPAMAELSPCKRDAREMPLCGSGKRCCAGHPQNRVTMFVVKKETDVDYKVEMKVTPGNAPLRARIVSIR